MASPKSESQGLQIALILFVLVTIVLMVCTYLFYRRQDELAKEVASLKDQLTNAKNSTKLADSKVATYKFVMGYDRETIPNEAQLKDYIGAVSDPEIDKVLEDYKNNMTTYAEGLADAEKTYLRIPEFLVASIIEKNKEVVGRTKSEQQAQTDVTAVRTQESQRTQEALAARQQAEDAQKKAIADLTAARTDFTRQLDTTKTQISQLGLQINDVKKKAMDREKNLSDQIDRTTNLNQVLKDRLNNIVENRFESPDGEIRYVSQRTGKVWINLGSADRLRPQVTFAVYPFDLTGISGQTGEEAKEYLDSKRKGRIEVVQILGDHLAEAKILDDSKTIEPLVPGDKIHTPAWRPGRPVRFALTGFMDVNNDGQSDREYVKNLIGVNGGEVDFELTEDGKMAGKITVNTRYMVKGDPPTGDDSGALTRWSETIRNAQEMGIEQMNLDQFLSYMGWKPEIATVSMSRNSSPETDATNVEGFQRRSPGASGAGAAGGAYEDK